jgi:hypothetical protein
VLKAPVLGLLVDTVRPYYSRSSERAELVALINGDGPDAFAVARLRALNWLRTERDGKLQPATMKRIYRPGSTTITRNNQ